MGLTRIRAEQISDIDYKQAVRAVATSSVVLGGGAPTVVDGVNLVLNDRVLVTNQSTGSQNGLYYVVTLGTGANGTWARTTDGNENGEIEAGMIVMVTEGTSYADTQWKLTTNNPITVGSTALTFVQNYSTNSIIAGTSNVVVNSNSNVTISSAGTSNVLVVTSTGANIAGTVSASGNITGGNLEINNANANIGSVSTTAGWYYETDFSVTAQDTEPRGVFFKPDGTRMYVAGNAGNDIIQYDLGTAWNVSTATYSNVFVVSSQGTTPYDVHFNDDGTIMYVLDGSNDDIDQYTLSSAWDIGSASFASIQFSLSGQESAPTGIWFRPDGSQLFVIGTTGDDVNEYNLGTAWNVSTASFVRVSSSLGASAPEGLAFSSDGTKMWIVGSTFNRITQFDLATPWNVSTLSYNSQLPIYGSGPFAVAGASGLYVNESAGVAYVSDYQNDRIFQYDTNTPTGQFYGPQWTAQTDFNVGNNLSVNANVYAGGSAHRFIGTVTAISAISSPNYSTTSSSGTTSLITGTTTGTLNFATGITTGTLNQMTAQTTGVFTLGGTGATGAITIGRSTANQSIVIGNGVTASGSVKTINIGTLGASGSNTNITIGSDTSGAVTTTTIYGNTNAESISATGNITGGNLNAAGLSLSGNVVSTLISAANITTTANIAGGFFIGNGSQLTGLAATYGNANVVANLAALGSNPVSTTGNITGGNFVGTLNGSGANVSSISATNISSGTLAQARLANASVTLGSTALTLGATVTTVAGLSSITSTTFVGALTGAATTAGTVTTAAQPNITSVGTLSSVSVTGNITGGNLLINTNAVITGNLSVLGTETIFNVANLTVNDKDIIVANNVTGGANVNGAGIQAGNPATATWFFNNATTSWQSNIAITPTTNGTLALGGTSNYWGAAYVTTLTASGNANVGNLGATTVTATTLTGTLSTAAQTNITSVGTLGSLSVTGNVTSGNLSGTSIVGTLTTAAQTNITSVGTLGSVSVTGNITGGNLLPAADNTGVVGDAALTWSNGQFTNLTVDSTLNVRAAIDLADSDILRFGSSDDTQLFYDGTNNTMEMELEAAAASFIITDNGTTRFTFTKATGDLSATSFTGSGAGLESIPGGNVTGTVPNANNSSFLNSISSTGLYNNMGQTHGARTAFDATTPSYDFGYRYVQGSTNGPGTGQSQYYSWYIGLGSEYPATGAGSYGAMFAVGRTPGTPYLSVRYNEGNSFGAWQKISAGSADTATSATTAGTVTTAAQGNITSLGTLTGLTINNATTAITNGATAGNGNIGASGAGFNTIFAKATSAQYADVAENYLADADYPIGTVLEFGGSNEVTNSTESHSSAVAGTVSDKPAFIMNSELTGKHVTTVALLGRVPCRVVGQIRKGNLLVSSHIPGVATALSKSQWQPGCVIGKALEEYNSDEPGMIEVVIGRF